METVMHPHLRAKLALIWKSHHLETIKPLSKDMESRHPIFGETRPTTAMTAVTFDDGDITKNTNITWIGDTL